MKIRQRPIGKQTSAIMNDKGNRNELIQRILIHFIYAGCTALALALTCKFSGSWFFYFILLLPFLYRISNVETMEAAVAGGFFALSLLFVVFPTKFIDRPAILSAIIISICLGILLSSVIISRFRRYFPLSILLTVSACFALQYLIRTGIDSKLALSIESHSAGFAFRAMALLGFLLVSLFIVTINTLLLILIDILCKLMFAGRIYRLLKTRSPVGRHYSAAPLRHWKCLPSLRGPPQISVAVE